MLSPPPRPMRASTTSSIRLLSNKLELKLYTIPATMPINTASAGCTNAHDPEMDTNPVKIPLFILCGEICFLFLAKSNTTTLNPPNAAAIVVQTAVLATIYLEAPSN